MVAPGAYLGKLFLVCKCMQKVSAHATCKSVHWSDLLYLGGIFVLPVVSFTQLDHTLGCSVADKIFQVNATFNMNQSRLIRGLMA